MPEFKQLPAFAVCLSGLVLAMSPESTNLAVAFIGAAILFGFELYLKSRAQSSILESELKSIKEKVEALMIKQGFGR